MTSLRTLANDMALVAQQNPHDYLKRFIVPEACVRKIAYNDQMVDVIFSFDIFTEINTAAWHLTVTPQDRAFTEEEMQEVLFAFFGVGPTMEITQDVSRSLRESFGPPMPTLQRQFVREVV